MTVKQQQALLIYLGYDPGPLDGLPGPGTASALAAFKADYGVGADGLVGAVGGTVPRLQSNDAKPDTGTFWDDIRYFKRNEFRCPCGKCGGFPVEPKEQLVRTADAFRAELGSEMIIVPPDGHSGGSGVRCAPYNATFSNSASNSRHLEGKAIDFSAPRAAPSRVEEQLQRYRNAGKIRYWYQISRGSWHMDIQ